LALPEKDPAQQGFGARLSTRIITSMLAGQSGHRLVDGRLTFELNVTFSGVLPTGGGLRVKLS